MRATIPKLEALDIDKLTESFETVRRKRDDTVIFVRVMIAPKTVSKIIRTAKVTFSGQIASLGIFCVTN